MGQVLRGSAPRDRGGPSSDTNSQESLRALAKRYGVNPKTVAKWKARSSVSHLPTGCRFPLRFDPGFPLRTDPA